MAGGGRLAGVGKPRRGFLRRRGRRWRGGGKIYRSGNPRRGFPTLRQRISGSPEPLQKFLGQSAKRFGAGGRIIMERDRLRLHRRLGQLDVFRNESLKEMEPLEFR